MKPICTIPSPYGVPIKVFHDPARSTNPDDCYFHHIDDCMTMSGIHSPADRDKCREAIKQEIAAARGIRYEIFLAHGGRKIPREAIVQPLARAYDERRQITGNGDGREPVEAWVTAALDHSDWASRADALLGAVAACRKSMKQWKAPSPAIALSTSKLATGAMEHLVESEIDTLEAAAFYAISSHEQWREAGRNWLAPVAGTWFRDWIAKRPIYRRQAAGLAEVFDIPAWLHTVESKS